MRQKNKCEVCGLADKAILHRHHIVPRCDPRCADFGGNAACNTVFLCPNCHAKVHAGEIIIVGVYSSTDGQLPVWFRKGEESPFPKEFWIVKKNPLIRTLKGDKDDLADDEKTTGKV